MLIMVVDFDVTAVIVEEATIDVVADTVEIEVLEVVEFVDELKNELDVAAAVVGVVADFDRIV